MISNRKVRRVQERNIGLNVNQYVDMYVADALTKIHMGEAPDVAFEKMIHVRFVVEYEITETIPCFC